MKRDESQMTAAPANETDASPRSAHVHANGLDLHVLEWPGPASRTVFVLHGYLDQGRSFVPLGDALARGGRRVIAPDFRGHGRSQWVREGSYYHFADYVADTVALMDALVPGGESVALVAHSMGGTVATQVAGAEPGRVRALALLEGLGPPPMPAEIVPDRTARWLAQLRKAGAGPRVARPIATLDEAIERLRSQHGGAVEADVLAEVAAELTEPHATVPGALAWRFDPLHQTTSPGRFDARAFVEFARRVTAPVLFVDAGASGFSMPEIDVRRAEFANGRGVTLEGAGHMMHWTQPTRLADAIGGFLDEAGV